MSELSIDAGHACLVGALVAFVYGGIAGMYGGHTGDRRWVDSARRAVYAAAALLVVCVVVLESAFLRSDFSVALVADHSSTTTPTLYKMTALWGSQGGSLLLWAFVLSLASSGVLFATRHKHREVVPWATAVLCGLGAFFAGLMIFSGGDAMPFTRMSPVPAEGLGLNPLLRHPAMAIHPPMLYSGYVLFSIPFAFAVGALKARRLDTSWIRSTRRFALLAWIFLSIGILLGAGWSYVELGWGGYWGWDPVENASLMPWLVGTAFLHSIMVQERRGMLKVWNVSLICGTFALSLLGTFLVRSGILQSIHAFGESTVGTPLLILIATVLAGSTASDRLPPPGSALRTPGPVAGVTGGRLSGQQHPPDRPCIRRFLRHLLPADRRGVHGQPLDSCGALVRPVRDAPRDPPRPLHGDRPAVGLASGQRRAGPPPVRTARGVRCRGARRTAGAHRYRR